VGAAANVRAISSVDHQIAICIHLDFANTVAMERERIPSFDGAIQRRLKRALLERVVGESAQEMSRRLYIELHAEGVPLAPEEQTPVFVFPDFSNAEVHLSSGRSIYANLQSETIVRRRLENEE